MQEYSLREQQALSFANTNYVGDVPEQVKAFAESAELTSQQATDIIIAQSKKLHKGLEQLGVLRMKKFAFNNMSNLDEVIACKNDILIQIKKVAESL